MTRNEGDGIPPLVKQLEFQDVNEIERVRITIKCTFIVGKN